MTGTVMGLAPTHGCDAHAIHEEERIDDARVATILRTLSKMRKTQEILYRTLLLCHEPQVFSDVEASIAAMPEYERGQVLQSPRTLIGFLISAQGIEVLRDDCNSARAGMQGGGCGNCSDNDFIVTTAAGMCAADRFAPKRRFEALIRDKPTRANMFQRIARFCEQPRPFFEIENFYASLCRQGHGAEDRLNVAVTGLTADYYITQLEKAGVVVWDGAWTLTPEGEKAVKEVCC